MLQIGTKFLEGGFCYTIVDFALLRNDHTSRWEVKLIFAKEDNVPVWCDLECVTQKIDSGRICILKQANSVI